MEPTTRKTSIKIWTPLLEKFNTRLDSACLRRDALLTKVLEEELDALDAEITVPNSEAARSFITSRLDARPRKLVTLTLPEELVRRLDDICERKRIVRDSYFNRLCFLLVADYRLITHLFFDGDKGWFAELLETTDLSSSAAGTLLDPIPEYRNPFDTIREGLLVERSRRITDGETAEEADRWLAEHGIYTALITDATFPKLDLYGLNVHLPDTCVPGTSEHQDSLKLLDEFLNEYEPSKEAQP